MGGQRERRVLLADRRQAIKDIDATVSSGANLRSCCKVLKISVRTYRRWQKNSTGDRRMGPKTTPANKLSERERDEVVSVCTSEKYRDKSPAQIVPLLADEGRYLASESTMYRIFKARKLDAHRSRSKPRSVVKPAPLKATGPNQLYSWDITYLPLQVRGMFVYLYFFVDIYSRKIVGYEVHEKQCNEYAANLMRKICKSEGVDKNQLTLHSDNGSPMKGATMLATLQALGVVPSFSRPSVSDDNPYSESLFKTLKYCPKYPSKGFANIEEASRWVAEFVKWYNMEHLHSGIKFVTPAQRHAGEDLQILKKRKEVYEKAKAKKTVRWSKSTRNWDHENVVSLNCLKSREEAGTKEAA